KAKRKRASPSQLSVLNRVFEQTFFPSTELRMELGKQLGMSPRTVQIWFQNKRQSIR
ncbi:Homeodomain-like DNA binding domain-containing transcription factor, partial [Mucor lusitanicus CBS 277.49]